MKKRSIIREVFVVVLVLCVSQVVFAQQKSEYKGVPMRDVKSYSLTFPLTVAVTVENLTGVATYRIYVAVDCACYFYGGDYLYPDKTIGVINGTLYGGGMIMNSETIKIPRGTAFWALRIIITSVSRMYTAEIQLDRVGPIDIDVNLNTHSVGGVLRDGANHSHMLKFE